MSMETVAGPGSTALRRRLGLGSHRLHRACRAGAAALTALVSAAACQSSAVTGFTAPAEVRPAPAAAAETTTLDPRIEALIAQMTVGEKVGQLNLYAATTSEASIINPLNNQQTFRGQLTEIRAGRVGGLFNGRGVKWARMVQDAAMKSRLKIPLILGADVIHGFRTVFPVPLAEAASWEPELAERTARVAATEAAASGIKWNFAPMVDVARDARWGRGVEGAGEDVLLGRLFAAARVRGFQGRDLADVNAVAATPKHFAAYGAAEGGADYNTVDISERTLREVYLPPFKAAFDAGAVTTMSAFNEIAGVPASGSPELLMGVLRERWGFEGFVVSDYTSEQELIAHGFAADDRDAARIAFNAGIDMSMQSGIYAKHLPELVASGEVSPARLDDAVRRVLRVKTALGLFDDPYRSLDAEREARVVGAAEHRALAREAGRRSIVMLKNEGDLLPLPKSGKRIALIGPFAQGENHLHGPWTLFANPSEAIDLATGLRRGLSDPSLLTVTAGSGVDAPLPGGVAAAVAAARRADVVLLAVGEAENMSGESNSRTQAVMPAAQQALVEAVAGTGKPVVILLRNGRALALEGAVRDAPAVLVTWFLGSEMGSAVADVLLGGYSPSGRLPVTFPQDSGQSPFYYSRKRTGRPAPPGKAPEFNTRYLGLPNEPLYPFGHGLGYGRVTYGALRLSTKSLAWDEALTIRATVTNTGRREVEEVVQLYVYDRVATITRPIRELKGFQKVRLAPGETREVIFSLARADLTFIGRDLTPVAEPGAFDVWVAASAATGLQGSFLLRGPGA